MRNVSGWLRTGDLAYYDDNGEIYIVDRISDFIIYRSINVSPAEIETVLTTHPAVLHAAVIGIANEVDEQHPKAFVVQVPNKSVSVSFDGAETPIPVRQARSLKVCCVGHTARWSTSHLSCICVSRAGNGAGAYQLRGEKLAGLLQTPRRR